MEPKTEITHITTPVAKYTLDFNTGVIKAKPIITRGDSIRAMTDEELAEFLTEYRCVHKAPHCRETNRTNCWLDWLREEASE